MIYKKKNQPKVGRNCHPGKGTDILAGLVRQEIKSSQIMENEKKSEKVTNMGRRDTPVL